MKLEEWLHPTRDVYYFTFADILALANGVDVKDVGTHYSNATLIGYLPKWIQSLKDTGMLDDENITDLDMRFIKAYLIPRSRETYVDFFSQFTGETDFAERRANMLETFTARFVHWWNKASDKYGTVATYYFNDKERLMDQISNKTTNISRFNDTPQGSGDFKDDPFTSNITQGESETKSDGASPIERLSAISTGYKSVLAEWCQSFIDEFAIYLGGDCYD